MTLFVDTSALYALMDRDDLNHERARRFWIELSPDEPLLTHDYVLVETSALVQRRLGIEALQTLLDELTLPISTVFVDRVMHDAAVSGVLNARVRQVSLVDVVSFEVMRRAGVRAAFTFDDHFAQFGFELRPD
ncbi:MAG TPA: PIN domain-containing protein [Candidatus Dormibacteraeota bacterium]|nr:PIN domain-containing protein [Candidatus Dormibacteraeota bacterium]